MPTIKLNEGQTIRVEDESQKLIDAVNEEPIQLLRSRKIAFKVLDGILLLFVLLLATRTPYIGSYPDTYLLEYIFGNTKYILYLWLILFLLFKIFGFKFTRFLYKKRFVIGMIFIWIATVIAISIAIYCLAYFSDKHEFTFKSYTDGFTIWANATNTQIYNPFMIHFGSQYVSYLSAGIIGIMISIGWMYISFVILGLIALIILTSGILIFFNKTDNKGVTLIRKWLIHLLGGSYSRTDYDELAPSKDDVKVTSHQRNEIKMEAIGTKQEFPPISFLTDTSVDHYFDNKSNAEKYQTIINKFMKRLGVESTYEKTIIMPQFTEIHFEVGTKAMIDEVLAKQSELLSELKISQFNISFKGNTIRFEIPNKNSSKVSLRSVFNTIKNIQPSESIIGLSEENTPLIVDTHTRPNTLIIGRRGSGAAMLLSSMLASLAYVNNPNNMNFIVLAPVGDKSLKYLDALPQMLYPVINELDESVVKLQGLAKEIEDRQTKFKESGATNLKEYNKFQTTLANYYKEVVLVISSFDKIAKTSLQNIELISNILQHGPKCGIKTILLSLNVNNESMDASIYDHVDTKCILRLESEQESLRIFETYRGVQLFGNGDGFFVDDKAKTKIRFQTCYLNVNELVEIIKIVKTFYEVKEEQRATSV